MSKLRTTQRAASWSTSYTYLTNHVSVRFGAIPLPHLAHNLRGPLQVVFGIDLGDVGLGMPQHICAASMPYFSRISVARECRNWFGDQGSTLARRQARATARRYESLE